MASAAVVDDLNCHEKLDDKISPVDVTTTNTSLPHPRLCTDTWSDLNAIWRAFNTRWAHSHTLACVRGPACSWCLTSLMNDCEAATRNQAEQGYRATPTKDAHLFLRRRTLALHAKMRSPGAGDHIFDTGMTAVVVACAKLLLARCAPGTFSHMACDALVYVRSRIRARKHLAPQTFEFTAHMNTLPDLTPAECALVVFYTVLGVGLLLVEEEDFNVRTNLLAAQLEADPRIVDATDFAQLLLLQKGLNFELAMPQPQLCAATEDLLRSHVDG
jgi:hypothetical protein